MSGFTQLRAESYGLHKSMILRVPDRMSKFIPVQNNTLHIIHKDKLWNTQFRESVEHSNKEVLLTDIRKELNVKGPSIMADHGKAGYSRLCAVSVININESPIHLVAFTRFIGITGSAVSLGCNCLSLRQNEFFMLRYVGFHSRYAARIADFLSSSRITTELVTLSLSL